MATIAFFPQVCNYIRLFVRSDNSPNDKDLDLCGDGDIVLEVRLQTIWERLRHTLVSMGSEGEPRSVQYGHLPIDPLAFMDERFRLFSRIPTRSTVNRNPSSESTSVRTSNRMQGAPGGLEDLI